MSSLTIAIDSGGSFAKISILKDEDTATMRAYTAPIVVSGALSENLYEERIEKLVEFIASHIHETDYERCTVVISSAAYSQSSRTIVSAAFEKAFQKFLPNVLKKILVLNDATALLLGHNAHLTVCAGTGSNLLYRKNGDIAQLGGEEWIASDYISGFWIGLKGLREVARQIYAGENDSLLVKEFLKETALEKEGVSGFLRKLSVMGPTTKTEVAHFAKIVAKLADSGYAPAMKIVEEEVNSFFAFLESSLEDSYEFNYAESVFVYSGSMFLSEFFTTLVKKGFEVLLPTTKIVWEHSVNSIDAALALANYLPDLELTISEEDSERVSFITIESTLE